MEEVDFAGEGKLPAFEGFQIPALAVGGELPGADTILAPALQAGLVPQAFIESLGAFGTAAGRASLVLGYVFPGVVAAFFLVHDGDMVAGGRGRVKWFISVKFSGCLACRPSKSIIMGYDITYHNYYSH